MNWRRGIFRLLVISLASCLISYSVTGAEVTNKVKDLLADCVSDLDSVNYSYCLGVLEGTASAITAMTASMAITPASKPFPLPKGYTDPQRAIVALDSEIARLSGNPYARDKIAALEDYRNRIAASINTSTIPLNEIPFAACFGSLDPPPVDLAQVFIDWAKAHPEALDTHQSIGILEAFRMAWPCH